MCSFLKGAKAMKDAKRAIGGTELGTGNPEGSPPRAAFQKSPQCSTENPPTLLPINISPTVSSFLRDDPSKAIPELRFPRTVSIPADLSMTSASSSGKREGLQNSAYLSVNTCRACPLAHMQSADTLQLSPHQDPHRNTHVSSAQQ